MSREAGRGAVLAAALAAALLLGGCTLGRPQQQATGVHYGATQEAAGVATSDAGLAEVAQKRAQQAQEQKRTDLMQYLGQNADEVLGALDDEELHEWHTPISNGRRMFSDGDVDYKDTQNNIEKYKGYTVRLRCGHVDPDALADVALLAPGDYSAAGFYFDMPIADAGKLLEEDGWGDSATLVPGVTHWYEKGGYTLVLDTYSDKLNRVELSCTLLGGDGATDAAAQTAATAAAAQ